MLIKLRHLSVESKFGRNPEQTSTLGVSKFGVKAWSTVDRTP